LELWPEACETAVYILLRIPQRSSGNKETPLQLLQESRGATEKVVPDLSHLRTFGCRAYVHIDKDQRDSGTRFKPRTREGVLVGFEGSSIYRVWIPDPDGGKGTIIRTPSVRTFDKSDTIDLTKFDKQELDFGETNDPE
jgi:hypothetical protein